MTPYMLRSTFLAITLNAILGHCPGQRCAVCKKLEALLDKEMAVKNNHKGGHASYCKKAHQKDAKLLFSLIGLIFPE